MSYSDFLEMYARDVKQDPQVLLAQKPLSFPVSTNQRGEALVDFFQRTTDLDLKGKRVLDVGCAYGGLSIALAKAGAKVSAIDVNPKFITYAQANVRDSADVELQVVDASSIGVRKVFPKGTFDLVVLNDVLEHIYDTTSLAANLDYLLSETGLVYFKVPNGSSPRFIMSEGHRKIFGLALLDPDCWFHLYPKRASIFYRPLSYFRAIFAHHGFGEINFVNEENVFPRFPIKKLRRQVRDIALHAREFEYPDKTVRVYLRHAIARFREEFEYDLEHQSEDYVKFKYGSYFFTGFAGRSQAMLAPRSRVRHVLGIGAIIDPHSNHSVDSDVDTPADDDGDDAAEPPPSAEICSNCGAALTPGAPCRNCSGPGSGPESGGTGGTTSSLPQSPVGARNVDTMPPANDADAANDSGQPVFQPSFDVRELRQCIAQYPLRPYERLERDSVQKEELEKLVAEGWLKPGSVRISLKPPIEWSVSDRGLMHRLNAWEPLSTLLAGSEKFFERRWFEAAYAGILDWLRQFQPAAYSSKTYGELDAALGRREDLVWYDMGVGFRCYRLAYVLDVAARDPACSDAEIELIARALYFHNEALSRTSFFRGHNNHGVYQALGQLACARRFPWLPRMTEYGELAAGRLERLCEGHFFESGVHKEHSPGYQYMVLNSLIGARNAGLMEGTKCVELLRRAELALMWMIMPDGRVCPIGDTDPRSVRLGNAADVIYQDRQLAHVITAGKVGSPPPAAVQAYSEAGYIFARLPSKANQPPEQWSYLAQISGFHSRIHKHADHLSFVWFERGQEVLADAGRYGYLGRTEPRSALAKEGYWYSNPKRMFVESTRAHNTIEIDGRDLPRTGVEPFGSAVVKAGQQGDLVVTQCKATYFGSVSHERVLVMSAGQFLAVVDVLEDLDGGLHDFVQRFNFAPQWHVTPHQGGFLGRSPQGQAGDLQVRTLSGQAVVSNVLRGQSEPMLLGWYSDGENSLVPASSVAFSQNQVSRALLVTLFAFGERLDVEQLPISADALASSLDLTFELDGRRVGLMLERDEGSIIHVRRLDSNARGDLARSPITVVSEPASVDRAAPNSDEAQPMRRLAITVDVEAQPGRSAGSHVDGLIWGRFPDGTCGINEMMSVADKHGAKLTMFLDYPEQQLYGEALLDVGREIHRRGHDLQLHLHQQFFSDDFCRDKGIDRLIDLNNASADEARVFADFLCEQHTKVTGRAPNAFRGGGYRFNALLMRELVERGVKVDSTYDYSSGHKLADVGPRKQFSWSCGAFELPISTVYNFRDLKRHLAYNFNSKHLSPRTDAVHRHFKYLDQFYREYGEDAIAVMVMHSWSLLRLGRAGHFEYGGKEALERFDALLEALRGAVEFVDTRDITGMLSEGKLEPGDSFPLPDGDPEQYAASRVSLAVAPAEEPEKPEPVPEVHPDKACPICTTPFERFADFNGPRRRCTGCYSVERQRVLAYLYATLVEGAPWRDLAGKRVLIIAPSASELKFLKRIGVAEIVTADIRPEVKPDVVVDVCSMPQIPAASFDAIVGSYVLTCVHDLNGALAEFARVLRPGGILYTSDPIAKGKRTEEYTDLERITSWYGKEAYEKYRVGSFRSLGALDVNDTIGKFLAVQEATSVDLATGTSVTWHIALKSGEGGLPEGWQEKVQVRAPAQVEAPGAARPPCEIIELSVQGCPICGDSLENMDKDQNCRGCGSRARLRALHTVMQRLGGELQQGPIQLPLLAFAMTADERQVLQPVYEQFKSVSLFGNYSPEHELGVDARDLSRYATASFSGHYGSLIFDYFDEHEPALREAFRVIAPGGVLLTHIAPYRLTENDAPARIETHIQQRQGYFDYIPKEVSLPSIKVGRSWFVAAMQRAGFLVKVVQVRDVASGILIDWFLGVKPASVEVLPVAAAQAVHDEMASTSEAKRTVSHTFSTPLDPKTGFKRVIVSVEVPSLPAVASNVEFAHHAFDTDAGVPGDRVYAVQRGGVVVSEDLGHHWEYVPTPATRDLRLWNAFQMQRGGVLLQALSGEPTDADADPRPPLFVCDESLNVVEELRLGREHWHGSRSIDESRGTIIYAEYPENSVKYRSDFAERREELLSQCRDAAVFRSVDSGRSWTKVFEKSWQEIRHFHSVAADPHQPGTWYLSSGDRPEECRVWRSDDDGLTWNEVTAAGEDVTLHPSMVGAHQAVNRYTDLVVLPDRLIWGSDDLLGNLSKFDDPEATLLNRVGSRVFVSPKGTPLRPRSVGFVGNHVRSMVDVGPGYLLLTEAKGFASGPRPQVCLMLKQEPYRVIELFTVDRHMARATGFTYSRASRAAKDGRFFSYRDAFDVFSGGPRLLQWDIAFE